MIYELGTTSADAITLNPKYDYKKGSTKIEDRIRVDDHYYVYKWGDYDYFGFSVEFITNSDAAIVNSWWESNTELLFFVTSDSTTEVHSVALRGDKLPLGDYAKSYDNYRSGKILLEGY